MLPSRADSTLFTYFLNILIQTYTLLQSYPSFAVILPFIVRFRTVIDYRVTHEYLHHSEGAEKHQYHQGLLTTSLNAYFATILISILLGQPVSLLIISTPLIITWSVYTLLWFIPIKTLHFISRFFRWIPSLAAIIFEYLLCISTIERAMAVSYHAQLPFALPPMEFSTNNVTPSKLLTMQAATSIPLAIICGFLIVHGNPLLGDMINIHGNFRVKTPSQIKNPFSGAGKIALNIVLLFVFFVAIFVPVEFYLKNAKPTPPNLLPLIEFQNNDISSSLLPTDLCITPQQRVAYPCFLPSILEWCSDHPTNNINNPTTTSSSSSSPSFIRELLCDISLATIHTLGLKECQNENKLPSVASQIAKQHTLRPNAAKSIIDGLYSHFISSTPLETIKLYPTTAIDQVGQPILARLVRKTIGSRLPNPYSYPQNQLLIPVNFIIKFVSSIVTEIADFILPIQYQKDLYATYTPKQCLSRTALSSHKIQSLFDVGQSTIPADTMFFLHIPTQLKTTIYPITFTLIKAILLVIWFLIHFFYILDNTQFQSKYTSALQQIWDTEKLLKNSNNNNNNNLNNNNNNNNNHNTDNTTQLQQPQQLDTVVSNDVKKDTDSKSN